MNLNNMPWSDPTIPVFLIKGVDSISKKTELRTIRLIEFLIDFQKLRTDKSS
jgi:hypothetical protein